MEDGYVMYREEEEDGYIMYRQEEEKEEQGWENISHHAIMQVDRCIFSLQN